MPTRRQDPDSRKFNQSAFASSVDFDRGILGNLVAARCHKLTDREEIAILWWLQQVSWRDGGLDKFVADFLAANHGLVGTRSMHEFGMNDGQIYSVGQVKAVRREMAEIGARSTFRLRGELGAQAEMLGYLNDYSAYREAVELSETHPISYPVSDFISACARATSRLGNALRQALVDPATESLRAGLWYFPGLWNALRAWRENEITDACGQILETEITAKVFGALDFAHESKSFVLIEGREGLGKSVAARSWCDRHPGEVVYVSLGSGTDEMTLFRSIARALGTACALSRMAGDIKARIEEALMPGHLTLVLDEAHFLWPQSDRSQRSAPKRVDWLRTALIDAGVPVVLISTPQYFKQQCAKFRKGGWNSNQIQRRLAHTVALPEALGLADARAMAKYYFPDSTANEVARIGMLSAITVGYLTTMEHLRKRVDFLKIRGAEVPPSVLLTKAIDEVCAQYGLTLDDPSGSILTTVQQPSKAVSKVLQRTGETINATAPKPKAEGNNRAASVDSVSISNCIPCLQS